MIEPVKTRDASMSQLSMSDKWLICPIVCMAGFMFSAWILPYYQLGDQTYYRAFYEMAARISPADILAYQRRMLGASEPIYGPLIWIASNAGVEKDFFISISNSVLAGSIFLCLRKFRANYFIVALFLSNYYTIVLMTSAERLKFGFIILTIALLIGGRWRLPLMLCSILGHFQMAITVGSLFLSRVPLMINKNTLGRHGGLKVVVALIALLGFVYVLLSYFGTAILDKLLGYMTDGASLIEAAPLVALTLAGVFFARHKLKMALAMAPAILTIMLVGTSRGNMIGAVSWLAMMVEDRRANNFVPYAVLGYFSYRSIEYINMVLLFGNGFVDL